MARSFGRRYSLRRSRRASADAAVIGPIPAEWIVDRGRHWLAFWRTQTGDTEHGAFMVLTACRMWRFAVERVHCSKQEAARWALDRVRETGSSEIPANRDWIFAE